MWKLSQNILQKMSAYIGLISFMIMMIKHGTTVFLHLCVSNNYWTYMLKDNTQPKQIFILHHLHFFKLAFKNWITYEYFCMIHSQQTLFMIYNKNSWLSPLSQTEYANICGLWPCLTSLLLKDIDRGLINQFVNQ